MDEKKAHRQLYRKIPDMKCEQACVGCCGTVPMSDWEADRLGLTSPFTPTDDQGVCTFSTPDGCSVYDKRPLMCRLFGTAEHKQLTCPKGMKPDKPLTSGQADTLRNKYITVVSHELFKSAINKPDKKPTNIFEQG